MSKVISIEVIESPEYVYDPICEWPHAYIADGCINHNCDEVDKGLGGSGGSGDSGASSRVLGTFLTWLQETGAPVFVVATANNITHLPAELTRAGRFDNIFSTGLPSAKERLEVLNIHLNKRNWDADDFSGRDKQKVITASSGYVGAEIEQAIKDALVNAFSENEDLTMDHVVSAINDIVPLSTTYAAQIAEMLAWAKVNATPASEEYDAIDEHGKVVAIGRSRTRLRKRRKPVEGE